MQRLLYVRMQKRRSAQPISIKIQVYSLRKCITSAAGLSVFNFAIVLVLKLEVEYSAQVPIKSIYIYIETSGKYDQVACSLRGKVLLRA